MIREICGGTVAAGEVRVEVPPAPPKELVVRPSRVEYLLGFRVEQQRIAAILTNLGFEVFARGDDALVARVPSWRKDIFREADLIEEVLRIEGFARVPNNLQLKVFSDIVPDSYTKRRKLRKIMTGLGLDEAIVDPFIEPRLADIIQYWSGGRKVVISNPMRTDQNCLRTALLPGLLKVVKGNHDRSIHNVGLFEVEKVYADAEGGAGHPVEKEVLGLVTDGEFGTIKGMATAGLNAFLPASVVSFAPARLPHLKPGRALAVMVDGTEVGWLGEVSGELLDALDLKSAVFAAEIDLDAVRPRAEKPFRSFDNSRIPKYPSVERDFAFVLDEAVRWDEIEAAVRKACSSASVEELKFFDIYRGKQIPAGKKSVALRVVFRSPDGTLTEEALSPTVTGIVEEMRTRFGAALRGQ
jgi:phenylalanyl-tRNA synthetase beta chain